jgi:hypothetical protein
MTDFPIADLFDDSLSMIWLERHLHPAGFVCPHCDGMIIVRFLRSWTIVDTIDSSICRSAPVAA